jgi:hypothetical protein
LTRKFLGRLAVYELETAFPAQKGGEKLMKIPDDIFGVAKEAVLRFGYFKPSLFVEGTNGKLYTHLPFGETNGERAQIMTEAGVELAKSGKLGTWRESSL